MIRRRTLVAAALALPAAARAQEIGSAQRPLRIGVTAGPHAQVMEKVREIAARDGLAIRIVEFQDYIQPNVALVSLVGFSAMAGAVGGGGLGDLGIRFGYQRFMPEVMATVVIVLILFVQGLQSLGDWLVRRLSHR